MSSGSRSATRPAPWSTALTSPRDADSPGVSRQPPAARQTLAAEARLKAHHSVVAHVSPRPWLGCYRLQLAVDPRDPSPGEHPTLRTAHGYAAQALRAHSHTGGGALIARYTARSSPAIESNVNA